MKEKKLDRSEKCNTFFCLCLHIFSFVRGSGAWETEIHFASKLYHQTLKPLFFSFSDHDVFLDVDQRNLTEEQFIHSVLNLRLLTRAR